MVPSNTWQQWYCSLVDKQWTVFFKPDIKSASGQYFENFSGEVYIRFPEPFPHPGQPDHKYTMKDGDFVYLEAGKTEKFGTDAAQMNAVVTRSLDSAYGYKQRRHLKTRAILYHYWRNQFPEKETLFSKTSDTWKELYSILTNHNCNVWFESAEPGKKFYYEEPGSWHGNIYIGFPPDIRTGNYNTCKFTILGGDFYAGAYVYFFDRWGDRFIETNQFNDKFNDKKFLFEEKCPESVSLDMKIALFRYWQTCAEQCKKNYGE